MYTVFANRNDAAKRLAAALDCYRGKKPLVLAIPRGAVPMGRVIADELDGELDYRKLKCEKELSIVPGATHLFEESGALEKVAALAAQWFIRHLQ